MLNRASSTLILLLYIIRAEQQQLVGPKIAISWT